MSLYPPNNEVVGGILVSLHPSVRPSVFSAFRTQWPLTLTYILKVIRPWLRNRVRSVASTVLNGLFLYLAHMITIIRWCVACNVSFQNLQIWIFGIFFKIIGIDLEKKSTVLDRFFPYLAQMITSMRGCVAYNDLWPWPISSRSFGFGL